ncbi:hypothetical protein [Xanthomonas citri]|uniref:hypothetical protein n=1 Tax=Xanthomonas citri TaxID=346 RepID=UPI00070FA568|nr:hypothetical protein [Xanthomonas citri]
MQAWPNRFARCARPVRLPGQRPALRRVRIPAALERLESSARAELLALINPRRACSEEELLFATVAWDLGLDGAAVSGSAR